MLRSIDEYTEGVAIRAMTYVSDADVFTHTLVEFDFDTAGPIELSAHVDSIRVHQYRWEVDVIRIALELCFILMLGFGMVGWGGVGEVGEGFSKIDCCIS